VVAADTVVIENDRRFGWTPARLERWVES